MKSKKKIIVLAIIIAIILIGIISYISLGSEWFAKLYGEENTVSFAINTIKNI